MHLDHVGVATDDITESAAVFGDLFDIPVAHEERFEGLRVVFLDGGVVDLELLEPLDPESGTPIGRFLDRRGPGLHHLAFEVPDVEAALGRARELGLELVDESPRPGARGHEVAFLHPDATGGVLVEFVSSGAG